MAHFARLDENNIVQEVVVISNDDCRDETGQESETVGIAFCEALFQRSGWIQTSYNNNFRGRFAGFGYRYLPERDIFVKPQPRTWYVLNERDEWICPIGTHPETGEMLSVAQLDWLETIYSLPRAQYPEPEEE